MNYRYLDFKLNKFYIFYYKIFAICGLFLFISGLASAKIDSFSGFYHLSEIQIFGLFFGIFILFNFVPSLLLSYGISKRRSKIYIYPLILFIIFNAIGIGLSSYFAIYSVFPEGIVGFVLKWVPIFSQILAIVLMTLYYVFKIKHLDSSDKDVMSFTFSSIFSILPFLIILVLILILIYIILLVLSGCISSFGSRTLVGIIVKQGNKLFLCLFIPGIPF